MRSEVQKILNLKKFFNIIKLNNQTVQYRLAKPSTILKQNIYKNWLQYIITKTQKHLLVYLNKKGGNTSEKIPYGFITQKKDERDRGVFEQNLDECEPREVSHLKFNLIIPEQDTMQYFIQWQRYRKFWWSSITTTPSLFSVDEITYRENSANVNIVAKFPWGFETVETLNVTSNESMSQNTSQLSCVISLEKALFILLLDGLTNSSNGGYLRLHRKIAPYKMSFMLDKDVQSEDTLKDLVNLLHCRLARNKISTYLPDFTLSTEYQLQDNLQLGVTYTIALSSKTLSDGIFHLLNSSTMLKEQVHLSDFDSYAALLSGK